MALLISVFEQGMIYAIMALGVYITYKILDFPDLTVDGTFPMGAAVTCILIKNGWNPYLTLPVSFLAGAAAGMLTGLIHVKLKVRDLLSGIIMMTALYTVNLRIAGKANLPIYQEPNIFNNPMTDALLPDAVRPYVTILVVFLLLAAVKLLLDWYLNTKSGFMLRAVGENETIVTSLGVDKGTVKMIGLSAANALVALSGCIFANQQRFFDISSGTGTVVIGLANVIIGTSLFRKQGFFKVTTGVIAGALLYKACVAAAVRFIPDTRDLKLVTAVLFLIILVIGRERKRGKGNA